jgi:hypothetical protein
MCGCCVFDGQKRSADVHRHHPIEQFLGILRDRRDDPGNARVREQNVDLAEALGGDGDIVSGRHCIGNIGGA